MKRREFINTAGVTCAGSLGLMWLLEACTTQKYIANTTIENNRLTIAKSEFKIIKKKKTEEHKFIIVKTILSYPIALYKLNDNEYKALYLQCTHQGCEVTPAENMLVCPCHGAEYKTTGAVHQGPAEIALRTFETTSDSQNIYIHLK